MRQPAAVSVVDRVVLHAAAVARFGATRDPALIIRYDRGNPIEEAE